ncbi:MAG: hypothetical protein HXX13_02050 [Bacteroidetes bacterium]|nr:hypothetical protein [Bacteroidota bacterium]
MKENLFDNPELVKLTDSLNSSHTIRLNLATFFATSHLAFLSYSLSEGKISILIIGSALLVFYMIADHFILRGILGYYIRAKRIIKVENNYKHETLFDMFRLIIVDRGSMKTEMDRIITIEDDETRFKAIKMLLWKIPSVLGFWVPSVIVLLEGLVAILAYNHIITIFEVTKKCCS